MNTRQRYAGDAPEVRRIDPHEWRQLRELRLRALRDTPLAFGSTYERESAYDDARWIHEAESAATGRNAVAVVAVAGRAWVGMALGYPDRDDARTIWLVGVFVEPAWRGQGIARAVSNGVIAWARERGAAEVRLHVADWNDAARRTYEALGFAPTGAKETLPHEPSVTETEMRLPL